MPNTTSPKKPNPIPEPDFCQRCETVALQYLGGEIPLLDAVDSLQDCAVAFELDLTLGQDAVQAIMATVFAAMRRQRADAAWNCPGWQQAAIEYHHDRGEKILIVEPVTKRPPNEAWAAKSTLKAAAYLIRENNPKRFEAWLLRHSAAERAAIAEHINEEADEGADQ
jgi:hypothetical protein